MLLNILVPRMPQHREWSSPRRPQCPGERPCLRLRNDRAFASFNVPKWPTSLCWIIATKRQGLLKSLGKGKGDTCQCTEQSPHLPPWLLGLGLGGHLDPIDLQGQVEHRHRYVLSLEPEAQPPVVAVPQQGPGSDGDGGPLPAVTIQPVLERNQVVEQVLQRHASQPLGSQGSGPQSPASSLWGIVLPLPASHSPGSCLDAYKIQMGPCHLLIKPSSGALSLRIKPQCLPLAPEPGLPLIARTPPSCCV